MKISLNKRFIKTLPIFFFILLVFVLLFFIFLIFGGLSWFGYGYDPIINSTKDPYAVQIKEKCKNEVKKTLGIGESDLKSCYLRDLQVWIICPGEELKKYNAAIDECLQRYGIQDSDKGTFIGG